MLRHLRRLLAASAVGLAACGSDESAKVAPRQDTLGVPAEPTRVRATAADSGDRDARTVAARPPKLSPLADSIARSLVFHAQNLSWLIAAAREGRLLVDLGRVDARVASRARLRAYREAVTALSPVRIGDRVWLRGPWGANGAAVTGFDAWNGRIVATLDVPPAVDSLAKRRQTQLVAVATRADSVRGAPVDSCPRDSLAAAVAERVRAVRDSMEAVVQADTAGIPPHQTTSVRVRSSQAVGCFGGGRALIVTTLDAGNYRLVRERVVLVDDGGAVTPLRTLDLRFRAHEALHALDADGDGIDDLAARARGGRAGETVVLRLDRGAKRLERLAGGFAWESY